MVDRLSGTRAVLPDLTLIEGRSTMGAASGKYLVLALVTQKEESPYLDDLLSRAIWEIGGRPSYVRQKPGFELETEYLEALGLEAMIYEADGSVLDLYQQFRPDDKLTGLVKCWKSAPDDEATVRNLYDEMVKYLFEYYPEQIVPAKGDGATEGPSLEREEEDVAAGREKIVDGILDEVYRKMMTATGGGNSPADIISEIYAEFQKNYDSLKDADMDDLKRMAMRRSHSLTARRKFNDLVLQSQLQLTRFLALYDDRRTSPDSAAFYGALEKGMDALVGFETALIDQGEISQKRRDAGRETAAALLEVWKEREKTLAAHETSEPEKAMKRMEAISDAVDRMKSLESVFEQAEAVVDAHLRKLEDEEKGKGPSGDPREDLNKLDKGSDSPYGRLPPK